MGFSHRFRAASSKLFVYIDLTEVSFGACWNCLGMGNHPAFDGGPGAITVLALWSSNIQLETLPDFHLRNHFLPLDMVCWDQSESPIRRHGWPCEPGQADKCLLPESGSSAKCHSVVKGES